MGGGFISDYATISQEQTVTAPNKIDITAVSLDNAGNIVRKSNGSIENKSYSAMSLMSSLNNGIITSNTAKIEQSTTNAVPGALLVRRLVGQTLAVLNLSNNGNNVQYKADLAAIIGILSARLESTGMNVPTGRPDHPFIKMENGVFYAKDLLLSHITNANHIDQLDTQLLHNICAYLTHGCYDKLPAFPTNEEVRLFLSIADHQFPDIIRQDDAFSIYNKNVGNDDLYDHNFHVTLHSKQNKPLYLHTKDDFWISFTTHADAYSIRYYLRSTQRSMTIIVHTIRD
jgi:hypothetical protein